MDKKLLWWIFGVSKGGPMRAKIVDLLHERPYNAHQLSQELGVDYKTVRYHLNILMRNKIVTPMEKGGIVIYFLSDEVEDNYSQLREIFKKLGIES